MPIRSKSLPRLVIFGALAVMAAAAAQAQVVVLEARGPSASQFPKGRVLPPNMRLDLRAGDVLRVIDPAGVHTLTGPLGAAPSVARDGRLTQIFRREDARVSQLAVARGAGARPRPRDPDGLWDVDVVSSPVVTACAAADVRPQLWRWSTGGARDVEITQRGGGAPLKLVWPAGADRLEWPSSLPVDNDAQYVVRLDDDAPVVVTWRAIGPLEGDMAALAQRLLDNGCADQFHTLEAVAKTDGPG
jgi:hypothetical protein